MWENTITRRWDQAVSGKLSSVGNLNTVGRFIVKQYYL